MTQGPDARRRQVLKDMIANLCWPQGSVSFWPFTMPQGKDLGAQVEYFLAGVTAIKASMVVTFGQELVELLVPNALTNRRRDEIFFIRGKTLVLLVMPDLLDLAAMDQQKLQAVCQQLIALRASV